MRGDKTKQRRVHAVVQRVACVEFRQAVGDQPRLRMLRGQCRQDDLLDRLLFSGQLHQGLKTTQQAFKDIAEPGSPKPPRAGVRKETFFEAARAEGASCFQYIPSPVSSWPRLHWQTYDGPKIMWTEPLRQSGIDYRQVSLANCEAKIAQSVEMGWNYVTPDASKMAKLASVFHKIEENLEPLRDWEKKKGETC